MKISLSTSAPKHDLLLCALFEKQSPSSTLKAALGKEALAQLNARIKAKDFEGKEGQTLKLFTGKGTVILFGRGDKDKQLPKATEHLGGKMAQASQGKKTVAVHVEDQDLKPLACGFVLGNYQFKAYKKEDKKETGLESLTFFGPKLNARKNFVSRIQAFMNSSSFARDLINTPAGDLNTEDLAQAAKKLAKKYKMKFTVLDDKKLKALGCGSIYAVGQGAERGSRMVFLEYRYQSKSKVPKLALIGKGITFDTGGLNIKPTGFIETMKQDMAGAATVMATLMALAECKVPGYFLGVLCCAENAVSERSVHPGDVLKAYNGKTIEVTNTDAEGRLVLADGLAYTEKNHKPKAMVTVATLTGAVTVALGYHITGVMGNDQKFLDELLKVSKAAGERMWPLPLDEDFVKATSGSFTDLKNATDGVRAGTIMGTAFLKNFVEKTPWNHMDIAGTAWAESASPTTQYGATGVAIRTLFELAENHSG